MTMTASKPWESSKLMIRSTDMEENGRGDSTARGDKPGTVGCVFVFAA